MHRREFLQSAAAATVLPHSVAGVARGAEVAGLGPVIDTHMHVWASDLERYPCRHPYLDDFQGPEVPATVEMLIDDMDQSGCTHAVLVQVIYHGWDNAYVADCVGRYPKRLRAHGLIDPTDPNVADRLSYWVRERGLAGMRFSPIYYQNGRHGGDGWLTADHAHRLWKAAANLGAVFNFFIAPGQLPRLEQMVRKYPDVRVVVDHLSQVNLSASDPEPDFRRLLAMGRHENVYVKVSELSSVMPSSKYPFREAYDYVQRVYEAFGPDRLLFGTGYPGTAREHFHRPTLKEEIDLFATQIPFFTTEDRARILGLNAARLWGF